MFKPFLLALVLAAQAPSTANRVGVVAGKVIPPGNRPVFGVQIILLPPDYVERWNSEVQQRLDNYWEEFKPQFIRRKELFTEFTRLAYLDSTENILIAMRGADQKAFQEYVHRSVDGQFEFRNVPFGTYKLLAVGQVGGQDYVWAERVEINSSVPHYIQLKKTIP